MITLFKKIRKSLIGSNGGKKYLLYAVGEIMLVVIGILIALQVNNWNESRKERAFEVNILMQFKKDLEKNLTDLKLNQRYQERNISSSKILLDHMKSENAFHDSLEVHFANVFIWTKFVVNTGAYQTLQSRGVELISDLELRDKILSIYEKELTWSQTFEQIIIDKVEHFRNIEGGKYFVDLNVIGGKSRIKDYGSLRNDNRFIYFLNSQIADVFYFNDVTNGYIESHNNVVSMIETALSEI